MKIKSPSHQHGLTLVELVVLIVIIAILGWGVGIIFPRNVTNIFAVATQLSNDIRYAQTLAMSKHQRFQLIINSINNTYTISTTAGIGQPNLVTGSTIITLGPSNIVFGSLSNLPNNLIMFDSRGTPYIDTGGLSALSMTAAIPIVSGPSSITVLILPVSGAVGP